MALDEVPAACGLLLVTDGRGRALLRLDHGLDENGDGERCLKAARRSMEDGHPVLLARPPDEHFLREDGRVGFHEAGSILCLPIAAAGTNIGALCLSRALKSPAFTPEDFVFLQSLTGPIVASLGPGLRGDDRRAAREGHLDDPCGRIVGRSEALARVRDLIRKVGDSAGAVFIAGESGTGTELVARAVHDVGPRRDAPFIAVNCSAIPETLLESELFGHARGAFTGAVREKPGLIEEADAGTFFMDEVGDLSPLLQAKLLRVLQDKEIRRVGENKARRVGVRFISATNRVLEDDVRRGRFREDLFYRLRLIPILIPPLRDRAEDLLPLLNHYLEVYCREMKRERAYFSTDALEELLSYDWPGNVRELQNEIQRCLILMGPGACLIPADCLSERIARRRDEGPRSAGYFEERARFEKGFLSRALALCEFNRTRTAEKVGLSRQGLYKLLKKHGIEISASDAARALTASGTSSGP
jgi:two-component system response regulator HupR/HoxA